LLYLKKINKKIKTKKQKKKKQKKKEKRKKDSVLNCRSSKEYLITSLGVLGSLDPFGFTVSKRSI
jgi:hypothetical protein